MVVKLHTFDKLFTLCSRDEHANYSSISTRGTHAYVCVPLVALTEISVLIYNPVLQMLQITTKKSQM